MFDPYHRWLQISKEHRPPNYFQLLGVSPEESDNDAIYEAYIKKTEYIRSFQTGSHADHATRILKELAEAAHVLGNEDRRNAYRAKLPPAPKPEPVRQAIEMPALDSRPTPLPIRSSSRAAQSAQSIEEFESRHADHSKNTLQRFASLILSIGFHVALILMVAAFPVISQQRGLVQKLADEPDAEIGLASMEPPAAMPSKPPQQQLNEQEPNQNPANQTPALDEQSDAPAMDSPALIVPQSLGSMATSTSSSNSGSQTVSATGLGPSSAQTNASVSRTNFFKTEAVGSSFVFVIDRSASMAHNGALEYAKAELLNSLKIMQNDSRFQVIFYSGTLEKLDTDGSGYLRRNDRDIARATEEIKRINPAGSTDHLLALTAAYSLKPEVIFFLTDADSMTDNDVKELTRLNAQAGRPATIHVVEFGSTKANSLDKPIRRLAQKNFGTYAYVVVQAVENR